MVYTKKFNGENNEKQQQQQKATYLFIWFVSPML